MSVKIEFKNPAWILYQNWYFERVKKKNKNREGFTVLYPPPPRGVPREMGDYDWGGGGLSLEEINSEHTGGLNSTTFEGK